MAENTMLHRHQLGAIAAQLVGPVVFALLVVLGGLLVSAEVDASLTTAERIGTTSESAD